MTSTTDVSPFSGSPVMLDTSPSGPAASGLSLAASTAAPSKPKSKPRKRVNTAEKRNQHNAIERQRRETLNSKFISLARLLPSLAAHRRPSKSAIVNGSISHLTHQREQRLLAARLLRQLCAERDALAKECSEWRYANGLPGRDDLANGASAWNDEMEEVCNVEKEQFGTFAGMDDGGDGEGEGDGDEDGEDMHAASSYGGSFSMPSFVHPPPQPQTQNQSQPQFSAIHQSQHQQHQQQQHQGEMSLEQAAAVAAHASFRSGPNSIFNPRASSDMDMSVNMNGTPVPSGLFGGVTGNANGTVNPWGSLSLQDLQAFAAANVASTPAPLTAASANANANGTVMTDMFIPASMSSSTASLPFNAFMSDDSVSPGSNSGYSQHIPTPPQSGNGHAFISSLPTVQQTPSPQSSHSFEDGGNGNGNNKAGQQQQPKQWTDQQLMLLRAIQQQQQRQQQGPAAQQQAFNPLSLSFANNAAAAFALGLNNGGNHAVTANANGNGNGSQMGSSPPSDSPYNMFASIFSPQQQAAQVQAQQMQQSNVNPLYSLGGSANGNGMGNVAPPPPLTRAQTENLEAWRKISAMPNSAYRTPMPMGMSFEQLQQVQNRAVEGF